MEKVPGCKQISFPGQLDFTINQVQKCGDPVETGELLSPPEIRLTCISVSSSFALKRAQ